VVLTQTITADIFRQIPVTKPKAIHFSTQSTEKHHKEKNILNNHQLRLLAEFSHVSVRKETVFSQNYFACQCIGRYKMSDTCCLLKSGSKNNNFFKFEISFHKD
jgi:hypothetical protein